MSAWVLPFSVVVRRTDRAEVARVVGVPYDDVDLRGPLVAVRVSDGDGDAMCDLALEGCSCASCSADVMCDRALMLMLYAVQDELTTMGARPSVNVGWHIERHGNPLAELRAPSPGLD